MVNEQKRALRLAVLIDADNVSPRDAAALFEMVAVIGDASVRRIYGDFSGSHLKGWSDILSTYAIVPHQNFATTTGKNASDIALVIDAMDLLYTGRFDAFCLVSSDSDFTRLAARIREHGVDVYGFGATKAPEGFRKACKTFTELQRHGEPADAPPVPVQKEKATSAVVASGALSPSAFARSLRKALTISAHSDGWYSLGEVGLRLRTQTPDFSPKAYGCSRLLQLVEKNAGAFEVRREHLTVYVRPIQ